MAEQSDDPDDRPAGDDRGAGRAYRRAAAAGTGDPSRPTAGPDRDRPGTDPGDEEPAAEGDDEAAESRDRSAGGGDETVEGGDDEAGRIQRPRRLYGFEHRTEARGRRGEPAERHRSER